MTEVVIYPVSPENVTVLGSCWKASDAAWKGLAFSHPAAKVRTQSTLALAVLGSREAPHDLHLDVPFSHPDDGPVGEVPDTMYRVRPRAERGYIWNGRKVIDVAIEPDPEREPPWRIVVTYAGKGR